MSRAIHPLRCRCGRLRGQVLPAATGRARCHCRDCQAFARFLGQEATLLDAAGGTAIVPTLPGRVRFGQGLDALACMSLSPRGLLRWYAGCCHTPIANTPRDMKMPYVGLIEACLPDGAVDAPSLTQSFGPVRIVLNASSATQPVETSLLRTALAMVRVLTPVVLARIRKEYRDTPFFDPTSGIPVVRPKVLTQAERERVTPAG